MATTNIPTSETRDTQQSPTHCLCNRPHPCPIHSLDPGGIQLGLPGIEPSPMGAYREHGVTCQRCWRTTTWNHSAVCSDCLTEIIR